MGVFICMLTLSSLAQRWHDQQEPEPILVRDYISEYIIN